MLRNQFIYFLLIYSMIIITVNIKMTDLTRSAEWGLAKMIGGLEVKEPTFPES